MSQQFLERNFCTGHTNRNQTSGVCVSLYVCVRACVRACMCVRCLIACAYRRLRLVKSRKIVDEMYHRNSSS